MEQEGRRVGSGGHVWTSVCHTPLAPSGTTPRHGGPHSTRDTRVVTTGPSPEDPCPVGYVGTTVVPGRSSVRSTDPCQYYTRTTFDTGSGGGWSLGSVTPDDGRTGHLPVRLTDQLQGYIGPTSERPLWRLRSWTSGPSRTPICSSRRSPDPVYLQQERRTHTRVPVRPLCLCVPLYPRVSMYVSYLYSVYGMCLFRGWSV